jgi:prophage regulatory protein
MALINIAQTMLKTNMGRSSVYEYSKVGKLGFPKMVKISSRLVGFIESEIDAWIAERVKAGRPSVECAESEGSAT